MKAGVNIKRHDAINIQYNEQGKMHRPGDQDKKSNAGAVNCERLSMTRLKCMYGVIYILGMNLIEWIGQVTESANLCVGQETKIKKRIIMDLIKNLNKRLLEAG